MKWDEISHEKWVEKLRKELKTENLEVLRKTFTGGIVFDPFLEAKDTPEVKIREFPDFAIGVQFNLEDDTSNNSAIHKLLPFDLRLIRLNINQEVDPTILLKGVHSEMLFCDLAFEMNPTTEVLDYFNHQKSETIDLSILKSSYTDNLSFLDKYVCHDFSMEPNPVEILSACKDIWSAQENVERYPYYKIRCPIHENILQSIPFFRALRIMFESKLDKSKLIIEAVKDLGVGGTDKNSQLIKASSLSMSAKMAGVDHLYFGVLDNLDQTDYYTTILNIQNIMELESHMKSIEDPFNGSYVIENLTQQYLNQVL